MAYDNKFQEEAVRVYAGPDSLLPVDENDGDDVRSAVREGRTGDTLLDFVFHEMSDVDSVEEGVRRLRRAVEDLERCIDALEDMAE